MTLNYKINIFKELIELYPTWEDLRKYLESEDGGFFKISDKNDDFCIIRYEKGISKMELPHSRWFRSVVWNIKTNLPVCVAPPKASSSEFAVENLNDNSKGFICQELLDGFMINCFKVNKTLHITSRSKLDASGKFYSDRSFRDLFMEAYMNTQDCDCFSENIIQDSSHDIRSPVGNEVSIFYSFVVQHKEHRIVKNIDKNCVFVVHRGIIYNDGNVEFEDSPPLFKQVQIANIPFDETNIQKWITTFLYEKPWDFQGIVFKDNIGNRWRFRSDKYTSVRVLRGNSSNICDRFTQLYSQNLLFKYLEYYKDEINQMTVHLMFLNIIAKSLYNYYIDLHITKTKNDIDKMFMPHLYTIHGLYLSHLKPCGKKVNINEITLYLQKQPWQRISFLIKKNFNSIES